MKDGLYESNFTLTHPIYRIVFNGWVSQAMYQNHIMTFLHYFQKGYQGEEYIVADFNSRYTFICPLNEIELYLL